MEVMQLSRIDKHEQGMQIEEEVEEAVKSSKVYLLKAVDSGAEARRALRSLTDSSSN